jgi:cob(I)alamin adenosyltransferase
MKKRQGFTHIYTGNGKGKTTAAMGLALRAAGAGFKVCFIQFLKGKTYSEHKALEKLPGLTLLRFGRDCLIKRKPVQEDVQEAHKGLAAMLQALVSGHYDMVVADEICVAQKLGLIQEAEVLDVIHARPSRVELILTGRHASAAVQRSADLITVMQEKKHYYQKGVKARQGIEY